MAKQADASVFGSTGRTVSARNKREAKKLVAEFSGNELMNAGELGNT